MAVNTGPQLLRINKENYSRFKSLAQWRSTGIRRGTNLPKPTEQELAFTFRDGYWLWAAELEGELVGWISFCLIPKPDNRVGLIFVDELWTAEEFRRRGIAKALLNKAVEQARTLNLWKVRLYVGQDNPSARALYRKMGFTEDDEAIFCQRNP